jgi:hypothetical protein
MLSVALPETVSFDIADDTCYCIWNNKTVTLSKHNVSITLLIIVLKLKKQRDLCLKIFPDPYPAQCGCRIK